MILIIDYGRVELVSQNVSCCWQTLAFTELMAVAYLLCLILAGVSKTTAANVRDTVLTLFTALYFMWQVLAPLLEYRTRLYIKINSGDKIFRKQKIQWNSKNCSLDLIQTVH